LKINGAIGPATFDYVKRGIDLAAKQHAAVIILQLNTPGGLDTSMRKINQAILASPIPVITYVAPTGARAASAGTFILYASHYSAMAPGTNIGAASPVNLMSNPENSKNPSVEAIKAKNDAAAYIKSLAELRGRNATWAESAVINGVSLPAVDAKKIKVIDDIADNYNALLKDANGHPVSVQGHLSRINTNNVILETVKADWRYDFLAFITNPTIAYLLMLVAIYGLFFELSNPGLVLPGVAGLICLILALYAFQMMPVNYTGLSLLLIGIAFMVFEVYVASFGVIGIGGVIAFILGSILLFDANDPNYHVTFSLIVAMGIVTAGFFFTLLTMVLRVHKKKVVTGKEGLIGAKGTVVSIMNKQIVVRVLGELWDAHATELPYPGQEIIVIRVQGLTLDIKIIHSDNNNTQGPTL
jgi:membrane-bound serine protease (ClpP class)